MLIDIVARFQLSTQLAFVRAREGSPRLDAISNPSFQ